MTKRGDKPRRAKPQGSQRWRSLIQDPAGRWRGKPPADPGPGDPLPPPRIPQELQDAVKGKKRSSK